MRQQTRRPAKRLRLIPTVRRSMVLIYQQNLRLPRHQADAFLLNYYRQKIEYWKRQSDPQDLRPYPYRFGVN